VLTINVQAIAYAAAGAMVLSSLRHFAIVGGVSGR
jgi:hypothetical protein